MIWELQKIFKNRYCVFCLVTVVLTNCLLFYFHLTNKDVGYSFVDLNELYELNMSSEDMSTQLENLNTRINSGKSEVDHTLISGSIYAEASMLEECLNRLEAVKTYQKHIASLIDQAQNKISLGFFGSSQDYTIKALEKYIDAYIPLVNDVEPIPTFYGSIEKITAFTLSDIYIQVFGIITGLILLTFEKKTRTMSMTKTTMNGHSVLFFRKLSALLCMLTIGYIIIYGSNFIISAGILGFNNLNQPIQSVFGMLECPYQISVIEYLFFFYLIKLLWHISVSSLFFAVAASTNTIEKTLIASFLIILGNILLGSSQNNTIRSISLTEYMQTVTFFDSCRFIDIANIPIQLVALAVVVMCVVTIASIFLAWICYCHLDSAAPPGVFQTPAIIPVRHTSAVFHELYLLIFNMKVYTIIIMLVIIQLISYQSYTRISGEWETNYQKYSLILSGHPTREKEEYLDQENLHFQELQEQISHFYTLYRDEPQIFELLTQDIQNELRALEPFISASNQYYGLSDGEVYIYQTGYEHLFGPIGTKELVLNTIKNVFALILCLSGYASVNAETGMDILFTASGMDHQLKKRRRIYVYTLTILITAISYLPFYFFIGINYGFPFLFADASCINSLPYLPSWCSICCVLIVQIGTAIIVGLCCSAIIEKIGQMTKSVINTVIIGLLFLLMPQILVLLAYN